MPISSYPRITLTNTRNNNNPQSGQGLAILNQSTGQYVIADSNLYPINNGGLASENTLSLLYNLSGLNAQQGTLVQVLNYLISANTYNQGIDFSENFTLPLVSASLPTQACYQVVLIAPANGFWLTINAGGEIFIPANTTIPVNVSDTGQLSVRYQTAGDVLYYYYH
jgi:hypothetical protein